MVELVPFPRGRAADGRAMGFTRDLSPSGLCLRVERPKPKGALLRVIVRGVDGRPALDSIARVMHCRPEVSGRHALGLALLGAQPPACRSAAPPGLGQVRAGPIA